MSTAAGLPDVRVEAPATGSLASAATVGSPSVRRVREDVRDGALLMAFSGGVSCIVAGGLVLLSRVLG